MRYRFFEMFQVIWLILSGFLFISELPSGTTFILWISSLFFSLCAIYWLNDYFDFESDLTNPRKIRHTSRQPLLYLTLGSIALSFALAISVSLNFLLVIISITMFSVLYSTPLLHLKRKLFFPAIIHFIVGMIFFYSINSVAQFENQTLARWMGIFWGFILLMGSLGNELVDLHTDKLSHTTVATNYPWLSKTLILGSGAIALCILGSAAYGLRQNVSTVFIGGVLLVHFMFIKKWYNLEPSRFRFFYRACLTTCIVVFCFERIYFRFF